MTSIEWTDVTWNVVTGCDRVSPGCDHCYAMTMAKRLKGMGSAKYQNDGDPRTSGPGFGITEHATSLDAPLHWRKPRKVFVNSMSDLFHAGVSDEFIARVWAVMAATPQHTYQVLTKRHGRMRSFLRDECRCGTGHPPGTHLRSKMEWAATPHSPTYVPGLQPGIYHRASWPLPNVWLGVSVEDQKRADLRIPALLDTPAAVRFLSCEPLLGPVDLQHVGPDQLAVCDPTDIGYESGGPGGWMPGETIDWVIVGGESGAGARPMHPDWARQIRDECRRTHTAFHFKQHGEWLSTDQKDPRYAGPVKGGYWKHDGTGWAAFTLPAPDAPAWVLRVGKKAAGRELDGRTWDEYPLHGSGDRL